MTAHELQHLFTDEMHICGCGRPEAVAILVRDILRCAPFYEEENQKSLEALLPSDGIFYAVLALLDEADLIEHGGSIGGSWLTPKGEEALGSLNELSQLDPELESIFPDSCDDIPPESCEKCYPVSS